MNNIQITFDPLPKINITGDILYSYFIELYEYRNNIKEHIMDFIMNTNYYSCFYREWYGDFQFDVFIWNEENGLEKIFEHRFNDFNKNVLITPLVICSLFNNCNVYCLNFSI
jgi:hypothetical protein